MIISLMESLTIYTKLFTLSYNMLPDTRGRGFVYVLLEREVTSFYSSAHVHCLQNTYHVPPESFLFSMGTEHAT